jgi:hypothetical protein
MNFSFALCYKLPERIEDGRGRLAVVEWKDDAGRVQLRATG